MRVCLQALQLQAQSRSNGQCHLALLSQPRKQTLTARSPKRPAPSSIGTQQLEAAPLTAPGAAAYLEQRGLRGAAAQLLAVVEAAEAAHASGKGIGSKHARIVGDAAAASSSTKGGSSGVANQRVSRLAASQSLYACT
jgi:hypothetical protein